MGLYSAFEKQNLRRKNKNIPFSDCLFELYESIPTPYLKEIDNKGYVIQNPKTVDIQNEDWENLNNYVDERLGKTNNFIKR